MRVIVLFALALALVAGLLFLPAAASLRERILLAVREFRAGWYGSEGYEARK